MWIPIHMRVHSWYSARPKPAVPGESRGAAIPSCTAAHDPALNPTERREGHGKIQVAAAEGLPEVYAPERSVARCDRSERYAQIENRRYALPAST